MSADWYETSGPSKGWKPSGVGLEDSSRSERCRMAQDRRIDRVVPDHGTRARYNRGCRCEGCRGAQAAYKRARRQDPDRREAEEAQRQADVIARRVRYQTDADYRERVLASSRAYQAKKKAS